MRYFFFLLLFSAVYTGANGQNCTSCYDLLKTRPGSNTDLWAHKSGEYLYRFIQCSYFCNTNAAKERAIAFTKFRTASLPKSGKYGWGIDRAGDRLCLIDTNGNIVKYLPVQWKDADRFSNNIAVLYGNNKALLYSDGRIKELREFEYTAHFSEGLLVAGTKDGKQTYIDTAGKQAVKMTFEAAGSFHEGLAAASRNGKYGFINKSGVFVIKPVYEQAADFYEGLARVGNSKKNGLIDKKGKLIIDTVWQNITATKFNTYITVQLDHVGLADMNGKILIENLYDDVRQVSDSVCWVLQKGKWHHYPLNAAKKSTAEYEMMMVNGKSLLQTVSLNKKYGLVNIITGEEKIPLEYDYLENFNGSSLMKAIRGRKYGFIDSNNHAEIPIEYDNLVEQDALTNILLKNGVCYLYSVNGKLIKKFPSGYRLGAFYNGLAKAYKDVPFRVGYINYEGEETIPLIYDDCQTLHTGLAWVKKDGLYGYIDDHGKQQLPFIYLQADKFIDGKAEVETAEGKLIIDTKGKIVKITGPPSPRNIYGEKGSN